MSNPEHHHHHHDDHLDPGSTGEDPAPETSVATDTAGSEGEISEEHNDADVMFAQMMIPHHQQAVEMSETLLAKDDIPQNVADFAQGVIDAQGLRSAG